MSRPQDAAEMLRSVELLQGLSKRELQQVAGLAKEMSFPAGKAVVEEGTPGGRFFLILEGTAEVLLAGGGSVRFGPGDYFGEMSLIDREPRSATVRATTPLRTLSLASFNFLPLLEQYPSIARKILVEMCRRLRAVERALAETR